MAMMTLPKPAGAGPTAAATAGVAPLRISRPVWPAAFARDTPRPARPASRKGQPPRAELADPRRRGGVEKAVGAAAPVEPAAAGWEEAAGGCEEKGVPGGRVDEKDIDPLFDKLKGFARVPGGMPQPEPYPAPAAIGGLEQPRLRLG